MLPRQKLDHIWVTVKNELPMPKKDYFSASRPPEPEVTSGGPRLARIPCSSPDDCKNIDGTYCDVDEQLCLCKPDYPVTDTKQCYKGNLVTLTI